MNDEVKRKKNDKNENESQESADALAFQAMATMVTDFYKAFRAQGLDVKEAVLLTVEVMKAADENIKGPDSLGGLE